jgi:hypothetical protein
MYLDRLPAAAWRSRADTRRLTVQLCDAIGHRAAFPAAPPARPRPSDIQALALPPAYADPRFLAAGYPLGATPGGTMRPDAATYIDREADARMRDILRGARGVTATIRAPRQSGKSSLLLRGLMQIQAQGSQLVFIDLQAAAFDSSIYGSVEDGGRGISGARLRITSADGRNSFNVRTGRGGVYSVPGLGCTKWTVRLLSVPNAPNGISANAVIVRNLNGGRYPAAEVRFRLQR